MIHEWQRQRLGHFTKMVSTGPFGSLLHKSDYVDVGVPLVNPINIVGDRIIPDASKLIDQKTKQRLTAYVLEEGDVVVGRRGEIGRCAVIGSEQAGWICGTGSFFIRPLPTIRPRFLVYLIRSDMYREKLEEASTGATMLNLSNSTLAELVVDVPPLPEQERIVGTLDEAFDSIATAKAKAEKNLQNARAIFESHLQTIVALAWSTNPIVTLSELAADITDGDHMPPPKSETGVPFITIGNIVKETRKIDFTDTFMVSRSYYEALKANRKPIFGDVLYTVTGSFGIPVIVDTQVEFCFQRHIGLIRPKSDTLSKWLYYLLSSSHLVKQAQDGATGTAQKTVSLKLLRGFNVPRVPLPQQQALVTRLDAINFETKELESIYQRKMAALNALKKSLLHQAFSGQL